MKSQHFPPNPQTGYSCPQELGLGLFIMTLCHFSFSKSDVISGRQRENRHNSKRLEEECEKVHSSTGLTKTCSQFERPLRSWDACLHCEQLLDGFQEKVKSEPSNILIKFYCPITIRSPLLSTAAHFLSLILRHTAWRTGVVNCKSQSTCYRGKMKCLLFPSEGAPSARRHPVISNFPFHLYKYRLTH